MIFSKLYVCLIAGLRDYTLESDAKGVDLAAILEEVFEALSVSDAKKVRLLYHYYDCENVVAAYRGRSTHNSLGVLTKEQIERVVSGADIREEKWFPKFLTKVVECYIMQGGDSRMLNIDGNEMSFEVALYSAYYEACRRTGSSFLKQWSISDRNIRNVSAAIAARSASRSIEDIVVGQGYVLDQLVRSSAVDFGLKGELDYIDTIISIVNDEQNILEKERRIDLLRWSIVEELSEGEYFNIDAILAYLIKINIVTRWRLLDAQTGREMFDKLLSGLSAKELINNK